MPIFAQGTLNTTALIVPDLYVQIVPPSTLALNGVPSNMVGLVGTAPWGPVNTPVSVSSMIDYSFKFGAIQARKFDMGTHAGVITQQGGNNLMCIRVTDGSETAATVAIGSNITFTAAHPGTVGNNIVITLQPGAQANSYRAIVSVPGYVPELFDNITSPSSQSTTGSITTHTATVNGAVVSSTTVVLNSNANVHVSDKVTGTGISGNPTVSAVNVDGVTITLSASQSISDGVTLTFQPSSSTAVTLASGSGILVGMTVTGTGVPGSTTIATVSGTAITLSQACTIANNAALTFTPSYHATWLAMAAAINNGQNIRRGASQWIVASATGGGGAAPSTSQYSLAGGADGVSSVTAATLVGDSATNTGMYALGGSGFSILDVSDMDDSTQFTVVDSFAIDQSAYAIQTLPSGTTVSGAVTAKRSSGLDSYNSKLMHGDWLYWNDPQNQVTRLVSPQAFAAGRFANMSAEQSSLNKPIHGVAGSQKSGLGSLNAFYSTADLVSLETNGIDVISNPGAGSLSIWTCRFGHNSSTNITIHLDNYPTLTNYIAKTLAAGLGFYLGRPITRQLFNDVTATLTQFMQILTGAGLLSVPDGSIPYGVFCDISNNPRSQTDLGIVQADVQAIYPSINEKFLVNLQGGNTVVVSHAPVLNQ